MQDEPQELLTTKTPQHVPCQRIALAVDVLRRFGRLRFRAIGGSMLPAIAPGDLLEFRSCSAADLKNNDVALLKRKDGLVAHRVKAIGSRMVVTRGDALSADDAPWDPCEVIGLLIGHERGGRTLHPGGRHWNRRQHVTRWLLRRVPATQALLRRMPSLIALVS